MLIASARSSVASAGSSFPSAFSSRARRPSAPALRGFRARSVSIAVRAFARAARRGPEGREQPLGLLQPLVGERRLLRVELEPRERRVGLGIEGILDERSAVLGAGALEAPGRGGGVGRAPARDAARVGRAR